MEGELLYKYAHVHLWAFFCAHFIFAVPLGEMRLLSVFILCLF